MIAYFCTIETTTTAMTTPSSVSSVPSSSSAPSVTSTPTPVSTTTGTCIKNYVILYLCKSRQQGIAGYVTYKTSSHPNSTFTNKRLCVRMYPYDLVCSRG